MKPNRIIIILLCAIILLLVYDIFFKPTSTPIPLAQKEELIEKKKEILLQKDTINPYANAVLTATVINSENGTFGYEIQMNGRAMVYQPNIPGLPGNEGFNKKDQAQKVADFVISKIRKNQIPPTITQQELDSLNVLFK